MKAAVCYEFGKPLVVEDIEPAPPRKGEVRVHMAATAICHSDIHDISLLVNQYHSFLRGVLT